MLKAQEGGDFDTETLVAKTMITMGSFKTIYEMKEYIGTLYTTQLYTVYNL